MNCVWIAATVVLACSTALLGYVVWVKTRRRRVTLELPDDADIGELFASIAALTWGHVIEGNRVDVIQNSAFFDALLDDIAAARHHIHLETFLWRDGAVSDRVSAALTGAARSGVEVRILVDQRGAKQTDPQVWDVLRSAGLPRLPPGALPRVRLVQPPRPLQDRRGRRARRLHVRPRHRRHVGRQRRAADRMARYRRAFRGSDRQRAADRVFEYERSGLHQKVMIVDGRWASIGSTNFDPRSFRINDEITVAMCDERIAAELRKVFEADVQGARE